MMLNGYECGIKKITLNNIMYYTVVQYNLLLGLFFIITPTVEIFMTQTH